MQIVREAGFSAEILPGCYLWDRFIPKRIIKIGLNAFIRLAGQQGLLIAPYYILLAARE
ncbi:MAG: hypothetical protein QXW98_07755 [Candidatus Caldarchaeum sp.]